MPLCSPIIPPLTTCVRTACRCGRKHAQFDQAVAEQDAVAARNFARHAFVGGADSRRLVPGDRDVEIVNLWPAVKLDGLLIDQQCRCGFSAPADPPEFRSASTSRAETSRRRLIVRAWSSCVPCEKLRRATSIPARINRSIISEELLAGPRVHTILALRKFMVFVRAHSTWKGMRFLRPTSRGTWRRSARVHHMI